MNKRANAENSVLKFLVECCDEAPHLESSGTQLMDAYIRFLHERNKLSIKDKNITLVPWLYHGTLYQMLLEAGFTKETRKNPPVGKRRPGTQQSVWFKGLAPKSAYTLSAAATPAVVDTATTATPSVTAPIPNTTSPVNPQGSSPTHITINGTLYERGMIATIKPIRGFTKQGTNEQMKAIVTFKNAEIHHQFITAEENIRVQRILGE